MSYSIKQSSRSIGIYKALGVSNLDIVRIFVVQSLLLALGTILLSTILHLLGLALGNAITYNIIVHNPIGLFYINYASIALAVFGTVALFLLASCRPILQLASKKPMHTIRANI